jgi:hypothetical protein
MTPKCQDYPQVGAPIWQKTMDQLMDLICFSTILSPFMEQLTYISVGVGPAKVLLRFFDVGSIHFIVTQLHEMGN